MIVAQGRSVVAEGRVISWSPVVAVRRMNVTYLDAHTQLYKGQVSRVQGQVQSENIQFKYSITSSYLQAVRNTAKIF